MKDYPEHDKLSAVKDKSQAIGEFLEWLDYEKNYRICSLCENDDPWRSEEYVPIFTTNEKLLAEFFCIDLNKLEQEKRKMLDELRAQNYDS
jgi:hypothetical protein